MARSTSKSVARPLACEICCIGLTCCAPAVVLAMICGVSIPNPGLVLPGSIVLTAMGLARIAPVPRNCTTIGLLAESIAEVIHNKFTGGSP